MHDEIVMHMFVSNDANIIAYGDLEIMYSIMVYGIIGNKNDKTFISRIHIKRIRHCIQSCSALKNTEQSNVASDINDWYEKI